MGKGQSTLFIILGIVAIILFSFFLLNTFGEQNEQPKQSLSKGKYFSMDREGLQNSFNDCSRDAIIKASQEYGLNEKTKYAYESFMSKKIKGCMKPYLNQLNLEGYIVDDGFAICNVEFLDKTIIVKTDYSIRIGKENQIFNFETYAETFPKQSTLNLDEGKELMLISNDNVAKILIKSGTVATKDNLKVDKISINIIDKHFDNLENNIVVGNLVYEALPDKTTFSKSVEFSIDLRAKDYPPDISINELSIAWWDEDLKIWRSLNTNIENGVARAEVSHFTKFAVVMNCAGDKDNTVSLPLPLLFQQKYNYKKRPINPGENIDTYANYLITSNQDTCNSGFNSKWQENSDGTIIPIRKEFLKILNNDPDRIDLTIQQLIGEKYTFGNGYDCEGPALVDTYCCCDINDKEECEKGPLSPESCWSIKDHDIFKGNPESNPSCPKPPYGKVEEQIKGYNDRACIGGTTTDGNGDNLIVRIDFLKNGDGCVIDDLAKSVTYTKKYNSVVGDEASGCIFEPKATVINENLVISIESSTTIEPPSGYCASCTGEVSISGTGIVSLQPLYQQCQSPDFPELTYNNGNLECRTCVPMPNYEGSGIYVINNDLTGDNQLDLFECSCTFELVGTVYCNPGMVCNLVNGVPVLQSFAEAGFTDTENICPDCRQDPTLEKCIDKVTFV